MELKPTAYEGDAALAERLVAAGLAIGIGELRDLVAGVAAAPNGTPPDAWTALVVPDDSDTALLEQLAALKDEIAAAADFGFEAPAPAERLAALRAELKEQGLDGFIVPRGDEYQNEFAPQRSERLKWLTGFSGSAGLAIVLRERAAIFVDGRYTIQVEEQVDTASLEPLHLIDNPPADWIADNFPSGGRLGYDPRLNSQAAVERFAKAASKAGGELIAVDDNPVDSVWSGQPPVPLAPIVPHELAYAGRGSVEKRRDIGLELEQRGVDAVVLTLPESIAWLLNVRGGDVPNTPLPLSFAIVRSSGAVDWFVDRRKLVPGLAAHLGNGVAVQPIEDFGAALEALGTDKVLGDPMTATADVFARLKEGGADIDRGDDPCVLAKARKNECEIDGMRAAHRRDGAALTRFLAWFAAETPAGDLTERGAADFLAGLRAEDPLYRGASFPTISSAGPNGAIVHYNASSESNRKIGEGDLYLVDSGGQYLDGTTDVTRTLAVGEPTHEMRDRFTRVLMGHIAIATARFPEGTSGAALDLLARQALWRAGLDFDHGTGHGVGSYLGVHEGPQRISKTGGGTALEPGMIVSNEPGYYKIGAYGIRIENLVLVVRAPEVEGGERPLLGFETLTRAPIDRDLVDANLLTADEIAWLDDYHEAVRNDLTPRLDDETANWLAGATRPLGG